MNTRTQHALKGALGGLLFGAASMIVPVFLKPGIKMTYGLAAIITVGMSIMGALFSVLNAESK